MSVITQAYTREEGNSNPPLSPLKSRKWCLTINNYSEEEYHMLHMKFESKKWKYVIGEEVGKEGTPHLQGFIEAKNAVLFTTLKKIMPRAHLEPAHGDVVQNYVYCSKDNKYVTNIDIDKEKLNLIPFKERLMQEVLDSEYKNVEWKDWQQEILDILDDKPNKRNIFWYWEAVGNIGKTYLAKWLSMKKNVIICDGKKDNIFNQVNSMIENEVIPRIIVLDIPRTSLERLNYGVIEALKGGSLYSGKYEGGKCIFPIPHVICFANCGPDLTSMSKDRWVTKKLQ